MITFEIVGTIITLETIAKLFFENKGEEVINASPSGKPFSKFCAIMGTFQRTLFSM